MVNPTAITGNIVEFTGDAIVNAANTSLLGGGGVDGAIHRAAGPRLLVECRKLNGCPTGEARITDGHNLSAKYIIHTVGPIWRGGTNGEPALLANCYRNSMTLAAERNIGSIAFPAISTGVYGYPLGEATIIAVETIASCLAESEVSVTFVCFDAATKELYDEVLGSR
jgi:O-acetyl-ADP-ribose deacetylase (regulator of RNase III)